MSVTGREAGANRRMVHAGEPLAEADLKTRSSRSKGSGARCAPGVWGGECEAGDEDHCERRTVTYGGYTWRLHMAVTHGECDEDACERWTVGNGRCR